MNRVQVSTASAPVVLIQQFKHRSMTFINPVFARIPPTSINPCYSKLNRIRIITTCSLISNTKSDETSVMTTSGSIFSPFSSRGDQNKPWVNVAHLHHALKCNHFVDLLDLYNTDYGLAADEGPSYSARMRALSSEFRRQVLGALTRAVGPSNVIAVPEDLEDGVEKARQVTTAALRDGAALLVNPVLVDESARIFARPPALMRTDLAQRLLNINLDEISQDGSAYIPIAIKRSAAQTVQDGKQLKRNVMDRLQAEVTLWAALLGAQLETSVPIVAVVGLASNRKRPVATGADASPDATPPFDTKVWSAALIDVTSYPTSKQRAIEALQWQISAVDDGATWLSEAVSAYRTLHSTDPISPFHALAANPPSPRHRPNMKIQDMYDWPWVSAKRAIAESIGELTLVSGVGNHIVEEAMKRDLPNNYRDERITAASLGIDRLLTERSIQMAKPSYSGPAVLPKFIPHNRGNWRLLEEYYVQDETKFNPRGKRIDRWDKRSFFVDFELASPDALHSTPPIDSRGSTEADEPLAEHVDLVAAKPLNLEHRIEPLIFVIGCGRFVENKWDYRCFTARSLSVKSEQEILSSWLKYMSSTLIPSEGETPYVFVWGPEQQLIRKAMNRMQSTDKSTIQNITQYKIINVFQVVTVGVLTIRGNLKHSIKSVAKALEDEDLLPQVDGMTTTRYKSLSGMDSMAIVLDLVEASFKNEENYMELAKGLEDVQRYNENDCLDIARIITYLRDNH